MGKSDSVVITGVGLMTPLGDSLSGVTSSLRSGTSCAAPLPHHNYSTMPATCGGFIGEEPLVPYELCPIKYRIFKPYLTFGVAATYNALVDSGLYDGKSFDSTYGERDRGLFVCQGVNGDNAEGLFDAFAESSDVDGSLNLGHFATEGINAVHPRWILSAISNNLIFFLSSEFGLHGDNSNMTYSAVGGSYMLEAAFSSLKSGKSAMAVVSASDSIINWQALDDIAKLGLLSDGDKGRKAQRMLPYSSDSVGALPSEGAASIVLELEESARARNARIYGRIVETRQHCAVEHLLLPAIDGSDTSEVLGHLLSCVKNGGRTLVNLNGMSAPAFDTAELEGLKKVVHSGKDKNLLCSSSKHLFCHTFSASFIIDLAATILAMAGEFSFPLPGPPQVSGLSDSLFCTEPSEYPHKYGVVLGQGLGGNTGGVLVERV